MDSIVSIEQIIEPNVNESIRPFKMPAIKVLINSITYEI
jgi:hypothetical protein